MTSPLGSDAASDQPASSATTLDTSAAELVRRRQRRQELSAFYFTFAMIFLLTAILCVVFSREIAQTLLYNGYQNERLDDHTASIRLFSVIFVIFGAGAITYLYATGFSISQLRKTGEELHASALDLSTLAEMVDAVRRSAEEFKNNRFVTESDRNIITAELEQIVRETLPKDFLNRVDQRYGSTIKNEKISELTQEMTSDVKKRLRFFQSELARKGAAYLAWGLATAATGIAVLLFLIFYSQPHSGDVLNGLFFYSARIGLIAIIEVIAFFFLAQYRFTILDEKYVNNEITNIDLQMMALIVAAKLGDSSTIEKILISLAHTERNFALKKGETSIFHPPITADMLNSSTIGGFLKNFTALPKIGKPEG